MGVDVAVILNKTSYIEREVADIKSKLEGDYVTQDQFEPVKKIVYGLVAIVLGGAVTALISLIIKN